MSRVLGGTVLSATPVGLVLARVPINSLGTLRDRHAVRQPVHLDIRPEQTPEFGPTAGAQVSITNADDWHAAGIDGSGIKIGVIDFFDVTRYWDAAEMGPAPVANVTARCISEGADCSTLFFDNVDDGGDDHGPAVVEVIKDMAPAAQIYIGTAVTTNDYYALVDWMADRGVKIISRSLGSRYDGPGDGRGAFDDVADHAVDRGMLWVNSAGNNGVDRYYRHPVRLAGSAVAFGPAGTSTFLRYLRCAAPGGVRWSNDWDKPAGLRTDYDVYLWESPFDNPSAGQIVASSTDRQPSGLAPLENMTITGCPGPGNALFLEIRHVSGDITGDVIEILDYGDGFTDYTQTTYSASTSVVDSTNPGVLSVGAVDPPDSGSAAFYSSQGPTNDGRVKPDLTAPSGFASATFGDNFSGTSASAPVVAGGAALALEAKLASGSRELGDLMRNLVVDRGPKSADNVYGTGEFRLPAPPSFEVDDRPSRYVPLGSPARLLDTRPGSTIGPAVLIGDLWKGEIIQLPVTSTFGIPATGITAVAVNLTLVDADQPGYGQALPTFATAVGAHSNFNLDQAGQTRPNFAIVPVGQNGTISIYTNTGGNLLVDVFGYFAVAGGTTSAGRLVSLPTPIRARDTRSGPSPAPLQSGNTIDVAVPPGVPAAEVAALVMNITGTDVNGAGFVTAFPGGVLAERDRTSTLNLATGITAANTAVVPVTASGVSLFAELGAGGSANVIVDVTGYITNGSAPGSDAGLFVPLPPARAADSRPTGIIADGATVIVDPDNAPGISVPNTASAVMMNLTATQTQRYGFATAWAVGASRPATSSLNWQTGGLTVANSTIVRPGTGGRVNVLVTDGDPATQGTMTHLIADVFGYFTN